MKKNYFKKITAVILCLVMFTGTASIFACAKEVSYTKNCPLIYIHGAGSTIYNNVNDISEGFAYPFSSEQVTEFVNNISPDLVEFTITQDWDKLGDEANKDLNKLLGKLALNNKGECDNNSGDFSLKYNKWQIKNNECLYFNYDWRLDPLYIAEQLNDFIEYICATGGYDKVCLTAHSNGGNIVLSYVAKYGVERLQGVILNSTALYGTTVVGELVTGKFKVTTQSLLSFTKCVMPTDEYNEFIKDTASLLSYMGYLDPVNQISDLLRKNLYKSLMLGTVIPIGATWPSTWAMTPDEYIEDGMDFIFNNMLKDDGNDYSELLAKIENFNTTVRAHREEILDLIHDNCKFGVLSRYGYPSAPFTDSWQNLSDGVVDVKYTSFGATVAPYGETLTSAQIAGVDEKYISPDKTINASTCRYPEQTWFIKNYFHDVGLIMIELQCAILYSDETVTVDTYEQYPRFMIYSAEEETTAPQTEEDVSFGKRVFDYFSQLFKLLKNLYNKIFG